MASTITAEGTEHTRCSCCQRKVEQRHLWGIDRWGITTAEQAKVDHFTCADCFASHCGSALRCKVRGVARSRPDLLVAASTSPHRRVAAPRGGR